MVTILGFFSISTGKRDIYILPAFPAAALLVGWVWSLWWQRPHNGVSRWAIGLPTLMLALTLCGLAAVIWGPLMYRCPERLAAVSSAREVGMWLSLLLLVGGTILGSAVLAQQTRLIYAALVGCNWLAMLMTTCGSIRLSLMQHYPIKAFSQPFTPI